MITLCEKCFPGWREVEVITIPPISPCAQCGVWDARPEPVGPRVHSFRSDPRIMMTHVDTGNMPPSAIEGVPIKEVMIDAICGSVLDGVNMKVLMWAQANGLANFKGNQWNEGWEWNRHMLGMLELDALFAVYGRVKRK